MDRRSTNVTAGFVHFGGDLTAHVASSHGVRLSGGSTGGIVEAVGDDTNVSLRIRSQGTGGITIGSTTQTVVVGAGSAFKGAYSTTFAYTFTALSSGATEDLSMASTTADVNVGDLYAVEIGAPAAATQTISLIQTRVSSAAASRVTLVLGNITSTAIGSTGSGTARISWLDIT